MSWKKQIADDKHFVAEILKQNKRHRKALEEIARGRFPGASYKTRKALEGQDCNE